MNAEPKQSRRANRWFLAAVGGAALVLLVTLLLPLGFDNDLYQSMGWALYASHGLPYIGSWDHNFPGIVFIHWASIALFGASDFGFRLFDLLTHIGLAAVYYKFLRNWLSPAASTFGVLLYALYYASGQWGLAGQRDTYAGFLLLGAASLFVAARKAMPTSRIRYLFIGVFCGAACLMRPTYILFAISFLVLVGLEGRSVRSAMLYLDGSLLPIAAFLIPYLFVPHGLEQVWDTLIRFNLSVYAEVHVPINLWSGGRAAIYILAAIGIFFALRNRGSQSPHRDLRMFVLFAVSALLSPIWMGKYFSYHFEPFVLVAIGLAARGFEGIVLFLSRKWVRAAFSLAILVLFAILYYPHHLLRYYIEDLVRGNSPLEATYERVLSDPLFGLAKQRSVVRYIDGRVNPREPVEYVSIFPGMRWRLGHPAATRFTSIVPLIAYQHRVPDFAAEWRREFLDTLALHPPKFVIVSLSKEWWPFVGKTNERAIEAIPGFDSLLAAKFIPDTVIGGYALYRPRS